MADEQRINYTGNSFKEKDEQTAPPRKPAVEKITSGEVIEKKPSMWKKISTTFTGDDATSVGQYVVVEILVPAVKNMLSDMVSQGAERFLFGENRARSSSNSSRVGYTPYNRMSSSSRRDERPATPARRPGHDYEDIILGSRTDADQVLDRMTDLVREYDWASVSDLKALVGITGSYVDDKYGWNDLRDARIHRVREGWLLEMPRTIALN